MCRGPVAVPALVPDVIRVKHGRSSEEYRGIPVLLELVAEGVEAQSGRPPRYGTRCRNVYSRVLLAGQ